MPMSTGSASQSGASRVWSHVLLATGCAIAITLLVTSYIQSSLGLQALKELSTQTARIDQVDRLQMLLINAETSVRGYLLTGEPVYLEPYEQAAPKIDRAIEQLPMTFADHANVDVAALAILAREKWKVMSEAVARRSVGEEAPDDMVGKILMDEVRRQLNVLRSNVLEEGRAVVGRSAGRFALAQNVGAALAVATLVLLIALFAVLQRQFSLRERIAQLHASENERLDAQVRERTDELRQLARYLTNAREYEKARLARELHDELGALLTAAKLDADWIARKLPDDSQIALRPRFDRLKRTLADGIALKRRIIDDLRPPLLKELGILESLRALAFDAGVGPEIQVDVELPDSAPEIDNERALVLFRIAQEAFTNALKYANPSHLKLSLTTDEHAAHLRISDDGGGFVVEQRPLDRHGIDGMKHRVQTYGGEFAIHSTPGQGTTISASVPFR
ncbi:CHASE3 domain-containing protein [Zoogloeaceae bacterium G21618-S1]|nr:CHASE3 domain-containing protein [Zoogloeaceae bacterium G21618-S1]